METKQIIEKTEALIDALRATCSAYGLSGDSSEYKIIVQVFLYKFLNDKFGYAIKESNGTQQPYVTWNSLSQFSFPYPNDLNIIKKYCMMTHFIINSVLNNEIQTNYFNNLRDSLLPMLMNGQVNIK